MVRANTAAVGSDLREAIVSDRCRHLESLAVACERLDGGHWTTHGPNRAATYRAEAEEFAAWALDEETSPPLVVSAQTLWSAMFAAGYDDRALNRVADLSHRPAKNTNPVRLMIDAAGEVHLLDDRLTSETLPA